jgi:hypothetical protein
MRYYNLFFFLVLFLTISFNSLAQGLGVNSCPDIEKRNNGNGQASAAAGNFAPYAQNNPVAANVVGTSYQNVPFDPSSKTGNFNFKWPGSASITNLPVVTRVWLTSTSNVTTLSPIVFGPPPPATVSGNFNYVNYCFYVQNMPPSGRVTLEFTDPQSALPAFRCTYDLSGNTSAAAPTDLVCTPTISTQPLSQTFCGNGNVTFSSAQTGASSHQWQYSTNGGSSWNNISAGGNFTIVNATTLTLSNRSSYNGNLFRIVYTNSCGSINSSNATLTVNSLPTAVFTNSSSLCGLDITRSLGVDFTGTPPYTFTYTTNGAASTVSNVTLDPYYLSVTPSATTTYILTSVSDARCTNSSLTGNTSITVNPTPTITPTNASTCLGNGSFSLNYSSTGSPNQYSLTTGVRTITGFSAVTNSSLNASPQSITIPTSGIDAGTYDFNMVVTNSTTGCSSSNTPFTLRVNSLPNVGATASQSTICAGTTAMLTASPSNLSTYAWRISPSSTILSNTVSYSPAVNSNTTFTVTGTDANGCSSAANISITTESGSPITITPSSPTVCPGNAVTILATGANSYSWSPSTGLSSTTDDQVVATPTSTTTYTVTAANSTGCQSIGTVTVTVASAPITVTASSTICLGSSQTLTASGGSTYIWYPSTGLFTDVGCTVAYTGTNLATVYAKPSSTTTYYVNGTTTGGCSAVASSTVTISAAPINSASSTPNNLIFCTQGTSTFPLNVVTNQSITSATWSYSTNGIAYTTFTTATTITGVTLTPTSTGTSPNVTYTCTLSSYGNSGYTGARYFRLTIVGSSCTHNYDILITDTKSTATTPAPRATQTTICNGDAVTLTIGALASGSTAQWESSPNNSTWTAISGATLASYSTGALSTNTYYRVKYNGGSGNCGSTTSSTLITVNTALSANTLSPNSTCSSGSGSITLAGSAITSGVYQWQKSTTSSSADFTDILGAVSQNYTLPTNIVSTQTWYRRIATNGTCLTNTSSAVVVTPPITGNSISTPTISYCATAPILTLSGSIPTGGNGTFTYQWQSSTDGTNFSNIASTNTINYTTLSRNQTYWYKRIVSSGQCSGDTSNTIRITVNANPSVSVTASATVCSGSSRTLTASGAASYSWSPITYLSYTTGSTVISTPTATTTYTVTGTSANGCTNTASTTVTVTSLPGTPTLSASDRTICSGQSQNLNSLVTSGGSYSWYTAPEANSSYLVANPTAVSTAANYYVFASNSGCYSSSYVTLVLSVSDVSAPTPIASSVGVCSPNTVDLTSLQPVANNGTVLRWHTVSSNPTGGNLVNPATSVSAGTYYLYAYSTAGACYGSASNVVTVTQNPLPTITPSPSTLSTCAPGTVDFTSTTSSQAGIYYQWYTANDNPPNPSLLVNSPSTIGNSGTYYVYAFNNSTGCISSNPASVAVTINPLPELKLTAPTVACSGATNITLSVAITNGITSPTYQWQIYNSSTLEWDNLTNGVLYSGVGTSILTIASNTGLDGSAYRCNVSKNGCSTNSDIGVIGVSQPKVPAAKVIQPTCSVNTATITVTSFPVGLTFSINAPNNYQSDTIFSGVTASTSNILTYTLTAKDELGCINSSNVDVNPQKPVPNPPSTTNAGHCVYSNSTGSVSDANGFTSPTFKWYNAVANGTLLQSSTATTYSTLVSTTAIYYVSVIHPVSGCESTRSAVTDTVIDPLSVYNPANNVYIWKGGASGSIYDWMTTTNWIQFNGTNYITVNQVPSSSDNVIIPPSSRCITAQPTVTVAANQFVNLEIKPGGVLTVAENAIMNLSGNWTNNGTFNCGTGTVNFVGSGNHFIQGDNPTTFYNLVVNKPLNGLNKSVLKLNTQAYITGQLTLTAGLFDISTFDINMDARTINGGSTASYVQTTSTGRLQRDVANSARLFPVGRSSYNPATLINSGISDKYSIRVIDRLTNIGTNAESDNQSDSAVVKRTWMIDENVIGGSDVTLRLDWNGDEHQTRFNSAVPYIVHYNSAISRWENKGWLDRTFTSTGQGQGFVQTSGITSFSPFGISSPEGGVALPVEFLFFNSDCTEEKVNTEWATASEHNSSHFVLLGSENGSLWREISQISAAGFSNQKLIYYSSFSNSSGFNYLKLNQFDIDGKMEEFGPFKIDCDETLNELVVFPNPADQKLNIQLQNRYADTECYLKLLSSNGKIITSKNLPFSRGLNTFVLDLEDELIGVYFIEVMVDKTIYRKKIVIM